MEWYENLSPSKQDLTGESMRKLVSRHKATQDNVLDLNVPDDNDVIETEDDLDVPVEVTATGVRCYTSPTSDPYPRPAVDEDEGDWPEPLHYGDDFCDELCSCNDPFSYRERDSYMCSHGNFAETCETCITEQTEGVIRRHYWHLVMDPADIRWESADAWNQVQYPDYLHKGCDGVHGSKDPDYVVEALEKGIDITQFEILMYLDTRDQISVSESDVLVPVPSAPKRYVRRRQARLVKRRKASLARIYSLRQFSRTFDSDTPWKELNRSQRGAYSRLLYKRLRRRQDEFELALGLSEIRDILREIEDDLYMD